MITKSKIVAHRGGKSCNITWAIKPLTTMLVFQLSMIVQLAYVWQAIVDWKAIFMANLVAK